MSIDPLIEYLPNKEALEFIKNWTSSYSLFLEISRDRKGKLGDYRLWRKSHQHKITINYNLPKELFFLTLTHEIAHMITYEKYKGKNIKPHGKEWKNEFSRLMIDSITAYSKEFQPIIAHHAKNPKAGYYSDSAMVNYFEKLKNPNSIILQNLEIGNTFSFDNIPFQLIEKRRTRFVCMNLNNRKKYLINRAISVEKINNGY